MAQQQPILILGGGINGAAIAREFVLQGLDVVLVDRADLAGGATAYSSRLIHGGLRYLEFAEFGLVAESLRERGVLLANAPQLVKPLRFFIPVRDRWSGLVASALRFCRLSRRASRRPRGRYVVSLGLAVYDRFSRRATHPLPGYAVHHWPAVDPALPHIGRAGTRFLCSYSDAQVLYPERFTIAMLRDAAAFAAQRGQQFSVFTYHEARLEGTQASLQPLLPGRPAANFAPFTPAAIINATGAWVDRTLARLNVASTRLIGGTKGSHLFTWNSALRAALGGQAVYAEAEDGRPAFVLPFGDGVLVGTTDIPCDDDPGATVATEAELEYLTELVNSLFPHVNFHRRDVMLHGCGVRPLPYVGPQSPSAITRRHQLHWHEATGVPLVSVIGGKLTTCRSLAEETVQSVLLRLQRAFRPGLTLTRPFPAEPVLPSPTDSEITPAQIQPILDTEWATTLADLVERRLMWLFSPQLSAAALNRLANCLVACGALDPAEVDTAVQQCRARLATHFGRELS